MHVRHNSNHCCISLHETKFNHCQENDKEMVSNLLAFRARLDVTVEKACDANESYRYKLKEAWEGFLNAR